MTPEEANVLLAYCVPWIRQEWATTKKVLEAVPTERTEYRPDPKSRTAAEVAWHAISSEVWFLEGLTRGGFEMSEAERPPEVTSISDMIAWYERKAPPLLEKLEALPAEKLAEPLSFFGLYNYPAVVYLNFLIGHAIHHRGQLAVYIRPMGGRLPSIYGGSADEPFEKP